METWNPSKITIEKIAIKTEALIKNFTDYLAEFDRMVSEEKTFGGPSLFFHYACISQFASVPMEEKLNSGSFYKYLYAVLASWGMYRAASAVPEMQTPIEFQSQILAQKDALVELEKYKIWDLDEQKMQAVLSILSEMFDKMAMAKKQPPLIVNSKVLHHMLPDLVPPIDRKYTMAFFEVNESEVGHKTASSVFAQLYPCYIKAAQAKEKEIHSRIRLDKENWHTSFTKVIDNAVVGGVRC